MNWELIKLADFLVERNGRIKHAEANHLGLQRIKKIDFFGNIHLVTKTDTRTDMIRVKCGDLVISGINAAKGAIAVYQGELDTLATIHYSAYRFNPERISVDFLKWFFKSPQFVVLLKEQVPGGIKTELKPKHILPLQVKLPKLPEQLRIANQLDRFCSGHMKLMREITHQTDLLSKLKSAILQEAIQGKLTTDWRKENTEVEPASKLLNRIHKEKQCLIAEKKLRKDKLLPPISLKEILFKIPRGWEWCHLDDILNVRAGIAKGGKRYTGSTRPTPYLRVANVQRGYLELDKIKYLDLPTHEAKKYVLQNDDLLVTEGGDPDKVGRCAVWHNEIEGCIHQNHIFCMKPYLRLSVEPDFVPLILNSPFCQDYFLGSYKQTTNLASINKTVLRSTPIALPSFVEQTIIVKRVEMLMTTCRTLEAEIENSRTHAAHFLQAVLNEAFNPA